MRKISTVKVLLLFILFCAAVTAGVTIGAVNIPLVELFSPQNRQILLLRSSRVILAVLSGAGLATSGIALQAVLRNPLAEPYLLGTSSGAGLGAVSAVALGISGLFLPLSAFIGALGATFVVYALARQRGRIPLQSLILSGVIVSVGLSAVIIFLLSIARSDALHGQMWWLWGSLQVYDKRLLLMVACLVIPGIAFLYFFSRDLNAISLGEEEAMHLGIHTETLKKIIFFVTSLITAGLVCVCGTIGFVGLIIPHTVRLMVGSNHKVLIPVSCVAGAVFMVVSDLLSRKLFAPLEIPVGVITAVTGAPLFIILLKSNHLHRGGGGG